MDRDEIIDVLHSLASQQGFYTSIYNNLIFLRESYPEKYDEYMKDLEDENFGDSVDVVMYFEGFM